MALKIRCECRKPGTLLLRRAVEELPIDQRRSALVGDSLRDIGAARNFGIWAYGVRTGAGCRDSERYRRETGAPPRPDLMFDDVSEAVDFDLNYQAIASPVVSSIRELITTKGAPILLGVCGRSRAGKTIAAHAIARTLTENNITCLHVRLDDWIVPESEREANCSAEARNRIDAMPSIVDALRAGAVVRAPGYDTATRGRGDVVTYNPSGHTVIVLEGTFAGHRTIRSKLDLTVFVAVSGEVQRDRFTAFYRWKGLDVQAIDELWNKRAADEWPTVDAQRGGADIVMTLGADAS